MNKRRIVTLTLLLVLVSGLIGTGCPAPPPENDVVEPVPEPVDIMWGSTSVRSGLFAGIVAEVRAVNEAHPGIIEATVVETGGFLENLARMKAGFLDAGMSCTAAAYSQFRGLLEYEGMAHPDLRFLGPMYKTPLNFVTLYDAGINTLWDLEGRPIATVPGASSDRHMHLLLDALGIQPDWQFMGHGAAIDAMIAGVVDGYLKAGWLDAAILAIAAVRPINLLPVTPEYLEKLREMFPGHGLISEYKPGGMYPGEYEDTYSLWYSPGTFVNADVPADIVYRMIEAIYEAREEIAAPLAYKVIGEFARFGELAMKYGTVPFHAGAYDFFVGRGYEVPDHMVPPERR